MAKRKNREDERARKADIWMKRTVLISQKNEEEVRKHLQTPRSQSIHVNPLKADVSELSEYQLLPVYWADTYSFQADATTLQRINNSALVDEGKVYIQNAASWLPVFALDPQPGERILDVCAAPGGKSSHIQALTLNRSVLVCNDNSKPRLLKLQRNMERLGAVAEYMLADATRLSRILEPASFDKILIDAPCSGEGLMTLLAEDEKLFDSWSVAHIRRLSDLQKRLTLEAWRLLRPGGVLVYSTCTMAPEENEAVVDYLLRKQPDAKLLPFDLNLENRAPVVSKWNDRPYQNDLNHCLRLLPSELTEAFFVAKITKTT